MFNFKYLNMFIYLNSDLNVKMGFLLDIILNIWVLPMVQWQRILLPMQETQETRVWSLRWENPLEKEMATHSSILTWENPMDRGAWQAKVHGVAKESDTT